MSVVSSQPGQRRSRSRRWPAEPTPQDRPSASPHRPAAATHPDTRVDTATNRALDEVTWPRTAGDFQADDVRPRRRGRASAPIERAARYERGALIGRGGMGEVYEAYDAQIGREVAIKVLHATKTSPSGLARFLREARIQGWLDHPAIPPVYELGHDDAGRPFFVMKRLCGITLFEVLEARRRASAPGAMAWSEQQLLRMFVEICLAIEFAHTRGVVHCDLKPTNILLGEFGEVYVLDWGVATVLDESPAVGEGRPTQEHEVVVEGALGTPGYMSPEQVRGDPVDSRADVYALGCILFELVAGCRLLPDGVAGLACSLGGVTAVPSDVRADVAPELDALCRRATSADRSQRIGSARMLGEAVQRYLDGDRDLATRRSLAQVHLERARRAVTQPIAMREAGRALALDPAATGAAELVAQLMVARPTRTPPAVAAGVAQAARAELASKSRVGIAVYTGYALMAPFSFVLGVRDAPYQGALVAIACANILLAWRALTGQRLPQVVVILGHVAMLALLARFFTPLLVAPGVAAVTVMSYAQSPLTTRRSLLAATGLAVLAVLGVWGAEACGLLSATMTVTGSTVVLTSPLGGMTTGPLVFVLVCYPIALIAIAAAISYAVATHGRAARRDLEVQAWQLRQLTSLDEPR